MTNKDNSTRRTADKTRIEHQNAGKYNDQMRDMHDKPAFQTIIFGKREGMQIRQRLFDMLNIFLEQDATPTTMRGVSPWNHRQITIFPGKKRPAMLSQQGGTSTVHPAWDPARSHVLPISGFHS